MNNKLNLFAILTLLLVLFVAMSSVCAVEDVGVSSVCAADDISVNSVSNTYDLNSNESSFDLEVNDTVYGDDIYINVHNAHIGDNLLNGTCYITFNNFTYSFDVIDGEGNCTLYPNRYVYIFSLNPTLLSNYTDLTYSDSNYADSTYSDSLGGIIEDYYLYNPTNIGTYVMNATIVSGDYNIRNNASFNLTMATPIITAFMQDFYYGHKLEYYTRVYGGFSELLASYSIKSPYGYIDVYAYWNIESLRVYVFDEDGNPVNASNLEPGNYSIIIGYIGDINHYPVNSSKYSFKVMKDHTDLFVNPTTVNVGSTSYITIALKTANYCRQMGKIYWDYKPLANAKVAVYFNKKIYQLTTDSNGVCKIKVKLTNPGNYDLTVVYNGDDYNQPCSKSVNIRAKFSFTINEIIKSAISLKNYASKNKKLPATIKVGSTKCSISQFSYLMASAIKNIAKKKFSTKIDLIPVKTVNKKYKVKVKVYKKDYLKIVNTLQSKGIKGKLPSYINAYGKKVGFNDYTYGLAKILKFSKIYKGLPNYVVFTSKY